MLQIKNHEITRIIKKHFYLIKSWKVNKKKFKLKYRKIERSAINDKLSFLI